MKPETAQRIEAIQKHWFPKCSASDIGRATGMTRNAVIGYYTRYPDALRDVPLLRRGWERSGLRSPSERKAPGARKRSPSASAKQPKEAKLTGPVFEPEPFACVPVRGEPEPLNLPLTELTNSTCKWASNDGDPFLFCGHETVEGKPWCPHHAARAVSKGTASERSAVRDARGYADREAA